MNAFATAMAELAETIDIPNVMFCDICDNYTEVCPVCNDGCAICDEYYGCE